MTLYLTKSAGTRDITTILTMWTWSGDKATISRQLSGTVAYIENSQLPVPEIGDLVTMLEGTEKKFVGIILQRSLGSEDSTMDFTAFDYGYYLQRNDGTYKFTGASPEEMTRLVCGDRSIPVAQLPSTGIQLWRKFAGVKLNQLITTVWTLASEKNGKTYALRYTPAGLLVKERSVSQSSLVLKASSNLMDATTKEDASQMVNSVAIYDSNGNFLRRIGDSDAQKLCGVMEQHITQSEGKEADADATARKALEDGRQKRTVTVNVLGDTALLTGETVEVREAKTGLTGIFWIDADIHTWKNKNYYSKLTLNCRNVMATANAGSEVT
nr:MAG TPA: 43 kDa tail protein [Caudoviricetes sp.]